MQAVKPELPKRSTVLTLYRCLLRLAHSPTLREGHFHETGKFPIPLGLPQELSGYIINVLHQRSSLHTSDEIRACIRWSFRDSRSCRTKDIPRRMDFGFKSICWLQEFENKLEGLRRERVSHLDRSGIRYHLGDVVRLHDNFCGVIVGWDRDCSEMTDQEKEQLDNGVDQPLYYLLRDNTQYHAYEAAENVQCLASYKELNRPRHIDCSFVFGPWNAELRRYTPTDLVRYVYPDNYNTKNE